MKQTEADVQRAIIEALIYDGYLILRVNQGGRHREAVSCNWCGGSGLHLGSLCQRCSGGGLIGKFGYTRFAWWQALGIDQQDSGISDVIALCPGGVTFSKPLEIIEHHTPILLAIECKASGKGEKLKTAMMYSQDHDAFEVLSKREKKQARFLWAVEDHGGIAIVADCLEDVGPYLERIVEQ